MIFEFPVRLLCSGNSSEAGGQPAAVKYICLLLGSAESGLGTPGWGMGTREAGSRYRQIISAATHSVPGPWALGVRRLSLSQRLT